jgi:2-C-methyl-D-erythritol 4-phosphate cytidylyltransferase
MKSQVPKQFIRVGGEPIIILTIKKFLQAARHNQILVTLPKEYSESWYKIKDEYLPDTEVLLVEGGKNRFLSVRNALNAIKAEDGLVAVHDAVRPFVPVTVINSCYESANRDGSGVAAISLRDSIREIDGQGSVARDRENFRLMQTPQTFRLSRLRDIYNSAGKNGFTDDASVWEYGNRDVKLVEGSHHNIKITFPEDIPLAKAIFKYQADSKS